MKSIVLVFSLILVFSQGKQFPEYLENLRCSKSDPKYEQCVWQSFEKSRPYFLSGIPELGLPPMDPFFLPAVAIDRTVNELVSIKAVLRNVNVTGLASTIIDHVKANPIVNKGEIRLTIPFCSMEMEYDVNGQLLVVPLRSKGFFSGNFTDTQIYAKGSLKTYEKNGEKYFRTDKFNAKITVGDGHINMISADPEMQIAADLISNFFNANPRLVMDTINPIFIEYSIDLFRAVADQILATMPANEWVPE